MLIRDKILATLLKTKQRRQRNSTIIYTMDFKSITAEIKLSAN